MKDRYLGLVQQICIIHVNGRVDLEKVVSFREPKLTKLQGMNTNFNFIHTIQYFFTMKNSLLETIF